MSRFVWIVLGGATGTAARYLISLWSVRTWGTGFPVGTVVINLLGCFLIAVIMRVGLSTEWISQTARMALTVGIMGGFTTYSSFNYETLDLAQRGAWGMAALNVAITLGGGLVAGLGGLAAAGIVVR